MIDLSIFDDRPEPRQMTTEVQHAFEDAAFDMAEYWRSQGVDIGWWQIYAAAEFFYLRGDVPGVAGAPEMIRAWEAAVNYPAFEPSEYEFIVRQANKYGLDPVDAVTAVKYCLDYLKEFQSVLHAHHIWSTENYV